MHLAWVLVVDMLLGREVLVRMSSVVKSVWHSSMRILLGRDIWSVMARTGTGGWQLPVAQVEGRHPLTRVVRSYSIQGITSIIRSSCVGIRMGSTRNVCPRIGLTWSAGSRLSSLCLRVLAISLHLLGVHRRDGMVAWTRQRCLTVGRTRVPRILGQAESCDAILELCSIGELETHMIYGMVEREARIANCT